MTKKSNSADNSADYKLRELAGAMLNIASISDIHLNHPNTPTELIVRNLLKYAFPDTKETKELHIVFIAGDFTDSLMDFASNDAVVVRKFVAHLLHYFAENDIMLRVLEGTPLHDWKQSQIFIELNENHDIGCDVRYVTEISIEHIPRYNIDVLYIPDESRPTAAETQVVVQQCLADRGLTHVDFAVMHGAFEYQLPDIPEIADKLHSEEYYTTIVRQAIFIGHIHQHYPKGKIYPHGSFDRLKHGEEEDKGHIRFTKGKMKFVVNHGAMMYKTLDVAGVSSEDIIALVDKTLAGAVDSSNIRLLGDTGDVVFSMQRRLSNLYPKCRFTISNRDKSKRRAERKKEIAMKKTKMPALTRENLLEELSKEIVIANPDRVDRCVELIKEAISAVG